jgi:hypothetical protein
LKALLEVKVQIATTIANIGSGAHGRTCLGLKALTLEK